MKKQIIILLSLGLLLVAGVIFFSVYQSSKIAKEISRGKASQEEIVPKTSAASVRPRITPSRPQDYGILVTNQGEGPKTQEEWDSFFSKKIQGLKSQSSTQAWNNVQKNIEKESPNKRQENLVKLEERIKKIESELKKNPQNKEAQDRLQRLIMLKSIAKELADK
ncbi:MAG: hypothetical protein PHT41_05595 [Candidatus Omnitrophica bacterium]|nr:hypothetical protein [Candidatus Omnitrophota bacterium]MDD5238695.1 hypothetical protein [Candidatus Omnitrophota bacterium]